MAQDNCDKQKKFKRVFRQKMKDDRAFDGRYREKIVPKKSREKPARQHWADYLEDDEEELDEAELPADSCGHQKNHQNSA